MARSTASKARPEAKAAYRQKIGVESLRVRRRGAFQIETANWLAEKLGLTERDIRKLHVAARRRNQETIARLLADRSKSRPRLNRMLADLAAGATVVSNVPHTRDLPAAPWTEITPGGGFERQNKFSVEGLGDGYLTTKVSDGKPMGAWAFQIPTPLTGYYFIEVPVFVVGPYLLAADEGHCESKSASIRFDVSVQIFQDNALRGSNGTTFAPKTVHDEIIQDLVLIGQKLQLPFVQLTGGLSTSAVVVVSVSGAAEGGGSKAEVDLSKPAGVMSCPVLRIAGVNVSL